MFSCFLCEYQVHTNKELLEHIYFIHPDEKIYKCHEQTCSRSFSIFRSFKRHRHTIHVSKDSVKVAKISNDSLTCHSKPLNQSHKFTSTSNILESTSNSNSFNNYLDNYENSTDSPTDNIQSVISDCANNYKNGVDIVDDVTSDDNTVNERNEKTIPMNKPENLYSFERQLINLMAQLYNFPEVSRNTINEIITQFLNLFKYSLVALRYKVENHLFKANSRSDHEIQKIFETFLSTLAKFETEPRRFTEFQKLNTFIRPEQVIIGERQEFQDRNGVLVYKHIPVNIQFIPMRKVLKTFFELPLIFENTIKYVKKLEDSADVVISNYIQGSLWKEQKIKFGDKVVFPLFMFYDDYESNNPLGSHRGIAKCGAVYLSVPCLPPEISSKLENIFLFILFNSLDRETFSNAVTFSKANNELHFLENEGIAINNGGIIHRVYFSLQLILGDNLGLHTLFGLNESFRSNHFCRFCLTHQHDINVVLHERNCQLRDEISYNAHVRDINPSTSGVKAPCTFHQLSSFHFIKNSCVDAMHDILEGVCQYDLKFLLHHFIYVEKKFTLVQLNNIIQGLSYSIDEKNKPVEVSEKHLKGNRIIMSAAEMLCLVKNLSFMVGHLIDENTLRKQAQKIQEILL